MPAVPLPKDGNPRTPLDFKLKSDWHFDTMSRTFASDAGEKFSPRGELPAGSRIVYKAPNLARADPTKLNGPEQDLRRYMQVILPRGESADRYLQVIRSWPPVEEARIGPEVSLP
jgi:hypothetical protein